MSLHHWLRSKAQVIALIIAAVHALLTLQINAFVPPWESYDETGHYAFANYISQNWALPPRGNAIGAMSETHQPPLYYWLAATAMSISGVSVSDTIEPHFLWARRALEPNPQLEAWPPVGIGLAVRLARLVSTLLSVAAVLCTFAAVRILFPKSIELALASEFIYAFWPINIYIGGVMNNDNGIKFAASLAFVVGALLVRAIQNNLQNNRRYALLQLGLMGSMGIAISMKDSGFAVLLFALLIEVYALYSAIRQREWKPLAIVVLAVALGAGLIYGAGIVSEGRTLRLLSTPAVMLNAISSPALNELTQPGGIAIDQVAKVSTTEWLRQQVSWYTLKHFIKLFVGLFGWGQIELSPLVYAVLGYGLGLATLGIGIAFARGPADKRRGMIFVAIFAALMALAPVARTVSAQSFDLLNGRFFLPAWSGFAILLAQGGQAIIAVCSLTLARAGKELGKQMQTDQDPHRHSADQSAAGKWQIGLSLVAATALFAIAATFPRMAVASAFEGSPLLVFPGESTGIPVSITFDDRIRLIGFAPEQARATLGSYMGITLYWEITQPLEKDYVIRVEGFSKAQGYSLRTKHEQQPANGSSPTHTWKVGEIYREHYFLQVWDHTPAPLLANFRVQIVDPTGNQELPTRCGDAPCEPRLGEAAITSAPNQVKQWRNLPPLAYWSANQPLYSLITTTLPSEVRQGEKLQFRLVWHSLIDHQNETKTFVHVLNDSGQVVAQYDGLPRQGEYPRTAWLRDEIIPDEYTVEGVAQLPAGTYQVLLGTYDAQSLERIPAYADNGTPIPNGAVQLGKLQIVGK